MIEQGTYVIVRSTDAGAFAGTLVSRDGEEVELSGCRRLWYWDGAATLSGLAVSGVSRPEKCKFPPVTPRHLVLGVCEVIPTSRQAQESIEAVPEWTA